MLQGSHFMLGLRIWKVCTFITYSWQTSRYLDFCVLELYTRFLLNVGILTAEAVFLELTVCPD